MSTSALIALAAIALVGVISAIIGSLGVRVARSTSDFLVASRTVGPLANASAISGEYLSAATLLGVAGLILREGADALWYAIAFTAGYLALLLFVAAPLRRSGAYTVPDFAEVRLGSSRLRRVCTLFVLLIGWLYLLPQLQGAGLTLTILTGLPGWIGVAGAGIVVVLTVIGGGMRSITFVQAFQYWLKLTSVAVPALIIGGLFLSDARTFDRPSAPQFPVDTSVRIRTDVVLQVGGPVTFNATGEVDGHEVEGQVHWEPGEHVIRAGSSLRFASGTEVPTPVGSPITDQEWLNPMSGSAPNQLLEIYSILIAGFLGTMGLPHVLVRFYTNPDGEAARRTTVLVIAMIGGLYLLVTQLGALSRLYTPQLLVTGQTDAAVLMMPTAALGAGWFGWMISGLVAAGVAAAFLATSSGLVVSLAGVLFTDVLTGRLRDFRFAAVLSSILPIVLALTVTRLDFALTVPLVFAVAASTFCPLLVLGIWWRGLTPAGAIAGVLVGGGLSAAAVAVSLFASVRPGLLGVLLLRPAAVTVPAAFLTMIVVSLLTRSGVPADVDRTLLRLHAPERLGLTASRFDARDDR
ncbi:sodium/solute symporter [Pseudonocardia asaccharolytica]|uniref:Cation acetate symporter n=1 Tax=Pseudonocardia asaccharolytica DSM 44247 = NBRC 16224 TaxID=1123024 RepID=A0A511CV51_9PSEU|nr:cation acetate symporter [Pseudonocardia asaccharolytica]GEL16452.1 cation acetate symporter [Pseudonocardia asaccharolytica DSM 44247 = NBRC 16224]